MANIHEYSPILKRLFRGAREEEEERRRAMKLVLPDSVLKIDRGGLLYLPDDQQTSFLFGGAILAPADAFKRVGSGQFEISNPSAVHVQALDIIMDASNRKAVVVGAADGDTAQASSMRGVFVAAVYLPLKKMGARYKNETDTFYMGAHQIKSVEVGAGLKTDNIDGFVKAYQPFRGFFKTAEALGRHLKLPFTEQIERMKVSTLQDIEKDVALKLRAQPCVAAKALLERNGQVATYVSALLKKKESYGLPFKDRFKVVAPAPAPTPPPATDAAPAEAPAPVAAGATEPVGAATGGTATDAPLAPASKAPAPASATSSKPTAADAAPEAAARPATRKVPPPRAQPEPEPAAVTAGVAAAGAGANACPTAPTSAPVTNASTGDARSAIAPTGGPASVAAPLFSSGQVVEDLDASDGNDDSLFGGDLSFPSLEELGKKTRKGRDAMDPSLVLTGQKRASVPAVKTGSAAPTSLTSQPSTVKVQKQAKLFSGTGTRGGHGSYLTIARAQAIAVKVRNGEEVSTPDQQKAALKLGKSSLLSPSPTKASSVSLDSAGVLESEQRAKRLELKLEGAHEATVELRGELATKTGELAAKDAVILANEKELKRQEETINALTIRVAEQEKQLEVLRASALTNFERGLEKGMASKFLQGAS